MRPNISMAALLGGDIDYIELIGSVIRSAARNLPVRAISTGIKAPFFSVIGQNKYKSIKDLKGAVIGLTSIGGTNHVSTRITLRQFGLDLDKDVKILAIGDEKLMVDTFKIGRVDAVVLAPPFSVQLKREGFPVLAQTARSRHHSILRPGHDHRTNQKQSRPDQSACSKPRSKRCDSFKATPPAPPKSSANVSTWTKNSPASPTTSWSNSFSRDGRVPLDGVDILLQIEKDAKVDSGDRHAANDRRTVAGGRSVERIGRKSQKSRDHAEYNLVMHRADIIVGNRCGKFERSARLSLSFFTAHPLLQALSRRSRNDRLSPPLARPLRLPPTISPDCSRTRDPAV